MPSSMWCSTASTTTIASSTTRPMASTRPNSDSVLIEKPEQREDGEGADQRHRHGDHRDEAWRASSAGRGRRRRSRGRWRSPSVIRISRMPSDTGSGRVDRVAVVQILREPGLKIRHHLLHAVGDFERVRSGRLEDGDRAARLAVDAADLLVVQRAELDARDILAAGRPSRRGWSGRRSRRTPPPSAAAPARGRCRSSPGPVGAGCAPIWPDGLTVLCCWTARTNIGHREAELSPADRASPRCASRSRWRRRCGRRRRRARDRARR